MGRELTLDERSYISYLVRSDANRTVSNVNDFEAWQRETHFRRLKHTPIIKGQTEEQIVDFLAALFRSGKLSHFQFEAASRLRLRIWLIEKGQKWQTADDEAHRLISAALHQIGAQRPPREEGQPEHTLQEWCGYCHGPLDEEAIARHDKFCDPFCARNAMTKRSYERSYSSDPIGLNAWHIFNRQRIPEQTCENPKCTRPDRRFRPTRTNPPQKYCSSKCWGEHKRTLEDRTCANPACNGGEPKVFHPKDQTNRFCCHECSVEGRSLNLPKKRCGNPRCDREPEFQPMHETQHYCSNACKQQARYWEKKTYHAPQKCELEGCDETFIPKKAGARFCSTSCQKKASYRKGRPKAA